MANNIPKPSTDERYIQEIVLDPGYDSESGQWGYGYSPDNGVHFFVLNSIYGRKFRQEDADRLYPFLKKYFREAGPIELSLHWADILDKPDLVTESELSEKLASIHTSTNWSDIADKPDVALKSDIPSVDGFLKLSDLSDYAKKSDIPSLADYVKKTDLNSYATKTDLSSVRYTAENASSTASSASSTASSAYSLASSANSNATSAQNAINRLAAVDSSNQYVNKEPSGYADGFSREIKSMSVLGINRSQLSSDAQSGNMALVETFSYSGYVRQTVKVLDGQRPMTYKRNGSSSTWHPWEVVHTTGGDWLQG